MQPGVSCHLVFDLQRHGGLIAQGVELAALSPNPPDIRAVGKDYVVGRDTGLPEKSGALRLEVRPFTTPAELLEASPIVDPSKDLTAYGQVYHLEITPGGRHALVAGGGSGYGSGALTVIDLESDPVQVIEVVVGDQHDVQGREPIQGQAR